jgi:hypothetical protein
MVDVVVTHSRLPEQHRVRVRDVRMPYTAGMHVNGAGNAHGGFMHKAQWFVHSQGGSVEYWREKFNLGRVASSMYK